jgi:hypothetical protein
MLSVFGDESHDPTKARVFAVAGLLGEMRYKCPHVPHSLGIFTGRRGLPNREAFNHMPEGTRILEYFCSAEESGCWIVDPARPHQPHWIELPDLSARDAKRRRPNSGRKDRRLEAGPEPRLAGETNLCKKRPARGQRSKKDAHSRWARGDRGRS